MSYTSATWRLNELQAPCAHCLDSGLLRDEDGELYPCGCEAGWAESDAQRDYCGKTMSGKQCSAVYRRPTVLHYISRLYLMCGPCLSALCRRHRGAPDSHSTMGPKGLRCGSMVIITEGGKIPDFIAKSAPDYMPVEDPRQFGLNMRGGAIVERWNRERAEEKPR